MEKKLTAVEWLIEQLKKGEVAYGMFEVRNQTEVFEQAKQMEREQIEDAHISSKSNYYGVRTKEMEEDASDYFTQTYQQ